MAEHPIFAVSNGAGVTAAKDVHGGPAPVSACELAPRNAQRWLLLDAEGKSVVEDAAILEKLFVRERHLH
jgi:hypothetical protein